MIICLIGIGLIVLAVLLHLFDILADKKYHKYDKLADKYLRWDTRIRDNVLKSEEDRAEWEKFRKKADIWYHLYGTDTVLYSKIFTGIVGIVIITSLIFYFPIEFSSVHKKAVETKTTMEYEMLTYRLERQNEGLLGNELLYHDILEYNKEVKDYRLQKENPWLSWLVPKEFAEFPLIEYK